MSRTLSRVALTAALLTPLVALDWSPPRRRGATTQSIARIGSQSDCVIQAVDPDEDLAQYSGGLSGWSRPLSAAPDPFPIRFWAFTRLTDGTAWQQAQRSIHHRLLMQAQSRLLATGQPLHGLLDGLRLKDAAAARRTIELVGGPATQAETVADLLHDLHVAA